MIWNQKTWNNCLPSSKAGILRQLPECLIVSIAYLISFLTNFRWYVSIHIVNLKKKRLISEIVGSGIRIYEKIIWGGI